MKCGRKSYCKWQNIFDIKPLSPYQTVLLTHLPICSMAVQLSYGSCPAIREKLVTASLVTLVRQAGRACSRSRGSQMFIQYEKYWQRSGRHKSYHRLAMLLLDPWRSGLILTFRSTEYLTPVVRPHSVWKCSAGNNPSDFHLPTVKPII